GVPVGNPSQPDPHHTFSDPQISRQGSPVPTRGARASWRSTSSTDGTWFAARAGAGAPTVEDPNQASKVCQRLNCGVPLSLGPFLITDRHQSQITCYGTPGLLLQLQPQRKRCVSPSGPDLLRAPDDNTSTHKAPAHHNSRAHSSSQAAAGGTGCRRHCAGVVEFYSGSLGGTISYEAQDKAQDKTQVLENFLCSSLQCGSFLKHLPETEAATAQDPGELREHQPLPIQWTIRNSSCTSLEHCFRKIKPRNSGQVLALLCSGFQPKVQSRLVGGSSICEGTVEVRQGAQWAALCDSSSAKSSLRWEEVCREQQCGSFNSYQALDAGDPTSRGLSCPHQKLSQCHELTERKSYCKKVFVTCQDPNPAGPAAGTVASIILALVLLGVLLVVCGPLAYKKLVKKFRQKKQRQWIGPTGMNQNMSFHRNHTATVRSHVENPTASHVDNEYSQPPRNSRLSAYPALEGALHRSSTQPDNSSDSDYDLHGAQRL
uniref:SRCR domain-containing protein n=1 Tax=Macaca mulatta TaxID=9544 RepID=A0A5F7ZXF9_MACMU